MGSEVALVGRLVVGVGPDVGNAVGVTGAALGELVTGANVVGVPVTGARVVGVAVTGAKVVGVPVTGAAVLECRWQ